MKVRSSGTVAAFVLLGEGCRFRVKMVIASLLVTASVPSLAFSATGDLTAEYNAIIIKLNTVSTDVAPLPTLSTTASDYVPLLSSEANIASDGISYDAAWNAQYGPPPGGLNAYITSLKATMSAARFYIGYINQGLYPPYNVQNGTLTGTVNVYVSDLLSAILPPPNTSQLVITSPSANALYNLNTNQSPSLIVPYNATTTGTTNETISFTASFTYSTSGEKGPFTYTDNFNSSLNTVNNQPYTGKGGQITVNAFGAATLIAQPIQYYIAGSAVQPTEITAQLVMLYAKQQVSQGTRYLLAAIACQESGYQQFRDLTLYGIKALWPTESFATDTLPAGSHIGLMMPEVSMARAFDWIENTNAGAATFAKKIKYVRGMEAKERPKYPGLRALMGMELENWSLSRYIGYSFSYYIPQVVNGKWDWVQNPLDFRHPKEQKHPSAAQYVAGVRAFVPTIGSAKPCVTHGTNGFEK